MANRNRSAGNAWEREIVKKLNDLEVFPKLGTTRELSRSLDAKKVDITVRDNDDRFDYAIQCKNTKSSLNYSKLLSEIDAKGTKVIFHKQTKKGDKNFYLKGKYAILNLDDFIDIISELEELRNEISGYRP